MTEHTTGTPEGLLDDWMPRQELAGIIGVSSDTLKRWETRRIGPPCIRIGRKVFYRRGAVKDWLLEQESRKAGPREVGAMRAVAVITISALTALILLATLPRAGVDWTAVLRFIAPTAFETRLIEEIIEGGQP